ncbi:unnamed protein product [Allacma fusca]|uniref:Innexin n=1 Tax=Allacma fusca TaxID=39272 RepID=A0A8J2JRK2_9HEXA|nr:unnamed protein product [Allacma fusca]
MIDDFAILKDFSNQRSPKGDNIVFTLHYRLTFTLLIICTVFISLYMHLHPDTIRCIHSHLHDRDEFMIDPAFINNYCWMEGIFTVTTCPRPGSNAHPFVSQSFEGDPKFYHTIYQWIPMILFLHAVSFYMPHYLWRCMEDGHLAMLVGGLRGNLFGVDKETIAKSKTRLVNYLSRNLGFYGSYFASYCFCESLNLIGILGQIFIANRVYRFNDFGVALLQYMSKPSTNVTDTHNKNITRLYQLGSTQLVYNDTKTSWYCYEDINPIEQYFPTVTKCGFRKYGPGGNLETVDSLCILGVNLISQVLFAVLWFWFVFVAAVTCLALLYRFLTIVSPTVRCALLRSRHAITEDEELYGSFYKKSLGDWYILYQLSKNLSSSVRKDVLHDLAIQLQERKNS